ncbi:MAG: zinc-binding dehydrogenase [Dehalococcoidia bacterium]|nr:zinc-binding dehydrogenase [Dehalococcoidia bacterium]
MPTMMRLEKLQGFGNVQMVESEVPTAGPDDVVVEVKRSLISRGSELFARYVKEIAVSPERMGYSDAGDVIEIGTNVTDIALGTRVMASAPHAQFVRRPAIGDDERIFVLPDSLSHDAATFLPLANGGVAWSRATPISPGDTVVVLGQGLVGNLYAQAVRERNPDRVIVIDATKLRCEIAEKSGAEIVLNAAEVDTVEAVRELTDGKGADVVVECVGGNAGVESFKQAQQMLVKAGGTIHLIALYQAGDGVPGSGALPLDSSLMQRSQIVFGYWNSPTPWMHLNDTAQMLIDGRINVEPLITHRMPWQQTPEAYHMLFNNPQDALGVIIEWD